MANAATLAAIGIKITALNDASATLAAIAKDMKGLGKVAVDDKGKLFEKIGLTGKNLKAVGKGIIEVKSSAMSALSTVGQFIPALGAIAGVGIVAGIAGMAQSFVNLAAQTGRTAASLGVPVAQFYNMQKAGELAGLSADRVTQGISGLQDTLADAAFGRNNQAAQMFKALGIDFGSAAHGATDVMKVLPQVANVVQRLVKSGNTHAALRFMDMAGVGRDMFTFLKDGQEGLARYNAEAAKSPGLSDAQVAAAQKLERAQTALKEQFAGMALQLGTALEPALEGATKKLTTFLQDHPEETKKFFDSIGNGALFIAENLDKLAKAAGDASTLWLVKKLFGFGPAAVAGVMLEAGRDAGAMGAPMTDDYGRQTGNWGGDAGQAIWDRHLSDAADYDPQTDPMSRSYDPNKHPGPRMGTASPSLSNLPGVVWGKLFGDSEQTKANKVISWYMKNRGYDLDHAAAMAANVKHESDFDPQLPGDHGSAIGLFQDRGDRRANFAKLFGHTIEQSKPEEQLAFADWELHHTEAAAGAKFFAAHGPATGGVLSTYFERPQDKPTNEFVRSKTTARFAENYQPPTDETPAAPVPMPAGAAIQPPAPSAAGGVLGGTVARLRVDVNHNNAPPGSSVDVASGHPAVDIAPVQTMRAMPEAL